MNAGTIKHAAHPSLCTVRHASGILPYSSNLVIETVRKASDTLAA
jgi:hypothetical protein